MLNKYSLNKGKKDRERGRGGEGDREKKKRNKGKEGRRKRKKKEVTEFFLCHNKDGEKQAMFDSRGFKSQFSLLLIYCKSSYLSVSQFPHL